MIPRTDQDSNDSLSISRNSTDSKKKLRLYYSTEKYLDIPLHQCDMNDIYFVKDTKSYIELQKLQSNDCLKFVNKFEDSEYMFFLQQKSFQCLFESENDFPDKILEKCFEKKTRTNQIILLPELNFSVTNDISDTSLLGNSTSSNNEGNQENKAHIKKLKSKLKIESYEYNIQQQSRDKDFYKKEVSETEAKFEIKLDFDTTSDKKGLEEIIQQILPANIESSQNTSGLTPISHIYKLKEAEKQSVIKNYTSVFMQNENVKAQYKTWFSQSAQTVNFQKNKGCNEMQIYQNWAMQQVKILITNGLQQYEYSFERAGSDFKNQVIDTGIDKWAQMSKPQQDEYQMNWIKDFNANISHNIHLQLFGPNFKQIYTEASNITEQNLGPGLLDILGQESNENPNNKKEGLMNEFGTSQQGLQQPEITNQALTPGGEAYEKDFFSIIGDFVYNIYRGKCKQAYANGDIYEGYFVDGKKQGKCLLTSATGETYIGDFVSEKKQGKGKHTYWDGSSYEGDFVDDQINGMGVYTYMNGDTCEGCFLNGKLQGVGKLISLRNNYMYEGGLVNDRFHGPGIQIFSNGEFYKGDFRNNKMSGKGTQTSLNGDTYEGDFKGGRKKGYGTYISRNGDTYIGEFKKDKKSGKGRETFANGDIYIGDFSNNAMGGIGKYYYANGSTYEGGFSNNKRNGTGKFTEKNGSFYETIPIKKVFAKRK